MEEEREGVKEGGREGGMDGGREEEMEVSSGGDDDRV